MADTSATIRLQAIDQNVASTLGNISTQASILTAASIGLQAGFGTLEKVSRSTFAQFAIGVDASEKIAAGLGKVATSGSAVGAVIGKLGDAAFLGSQLATVGQGVAGAVEQWSRIPATLASMQASGVSTQPIEDFNSLTEAVKGSGSSIDSFVTNAIAQLGQFEGAAARAGTILRSSTRFNDAGGAERATKAEQLQNAFQVQKLVNDELDNTVSSTAALSAQYDVLSSGFTKAADSQKTLAAGLKLVGIGEAGGVAAPVSATTRLLTSTMNAYEQTADQAAETAGVINGIVESGLTTIPELLDLGATAKQASAAGVSLKDLGASVAVLTSQGVNTAESLTGLSGLTGSILNKTPQAQEALEKLSLSGQKLRFDKAEIQSKGLVQALTDVNKAAGGSAQTLAEIFPDEVTYRTVLALLAQSGEKLKGVREGIESAGAQSLDEVFKIASEDRVSRMEKIANRFQEAIIQIAASLAPVLEPGLNALETLANAFNSLPDSVKQGIGAYISAQIQFRAGSAAAGVLVDTLKSLATNYLITRGASLLLTGQLGKELGVIRDLFTQRKGLLAVGLQIFGIDQRAKLVSQEATEALTKQSAAARLLTSARTKLSEVVGRNVQSFQQTRLTPEALGQLKETGGAIASQARDAVIGGVGKATSEEARASAIAASEDLWKATKERAASAAQEISKSAGAIGTGLGQAVGVIPSPQILGPDGKPLSSGGIESVRAEFQRIGGAVSEAAQNTFTGLKDQFGKPLPIPQIDVAAAKEKAYEIGEALSEAIPKGLATNIANPDAISKQLQSVAEQTAGTLKDGIPGIGATDEQGIVDELTRRDARLNKLSKSSTAARKQFQDAQSELAKQQQRIESLGETVEEKRQALEDYRASVVQSFTDRAIPESEQSTVLKRLQTEQSEFDKLQAKFEAEQNRGVELQENLDKRRDVAARASTNTLNARVAATERYEQVATKLIAAREAEVVATEAERAAHLANSKALQLETVLGRESTIATEARAEASLKTEEAQRSRREARTRSGEVRAAYDPVGTLVESTEGRVAQQTTDLVQLDTEARKRSSQASADRAKWLGLEAEAQNKAAQAAEISQRIEEKSTALVEKRSQASELFLSQTATREEKQKAFNEVLKQEQSLERDRVRLQAAQSETESLSTQITEARTKATESSSASVQARLAAEQRLEPVARAMVEADLAQTAATQSRQAATIAAAEATQLEAALGLQDERAITSRTRARVLGTEATQLETLATRRATTANTLYRAEAQASELAEKGLAEARVFGRTVTYSLTGPLAGLNKLLATEITLKSTAAGVTGIYTAAQAGLGKVVGGVGALLRGDFSKVIDTAAKLGSGGLKGIGSGLGAIGGGIKTLMAPLGLVGPLLIPLTIGVAAFREDIWGVGAAAREASKGFEEFQKKQSDLERQLQGQEGLSRLREQTKALLNDSTYIADASKSATQAGETVQRGFVEKAFSIPGEAFSGIGKGVGDFFGGIGKTLNDSANQELTQIAVPATEKLKPFRSELDQLRESGAITSGQFALLSKSLNDVGTSGDINTEKLKAFKGQLDAVMQGASGEIEKGFTDRITEAVTSIPGKIGEGFDFVTAIPGGFALAAKEALAGEDLGKVGQDFLSDNYIGKAQSEREADRLIRPISEIGIALEDVGNASIATQEAIGKYSKGLALTADVTAKVRQGTKLTAVDLEAENKAFKDRSELNQGQISGLNEQIKKYEEVAAKIKDPEIKASFQGRIDALKSQVGLLEKYSEKQKAANEAFNKYQLETLPNLIQALNESSDPTKALQQAGETFRQQYQTDAEGKVTPFIKDISTLRQEAQRYQVQITDALSTGEFDTKIEAAYGVKIVPGQAEEEAARRLQEVRDSQVKYLQDGVEKSGFRLSIADRKALTQQVSELQNEGLKREEASANLGLERSKNLQRSQVQSAAETEDKIAEIQKGNLNRQLKQRENEIAEYKKAGFRTVDLETQASQLRIQVETAEIEQRDRLRQRSLDRRLKALDLEAERIKTAQARRTVTGEEAEEGLANVQVKQAQLRLDQLKAERAKRAKPDPELNNQIAQAEEQIAQTAAQRDDQRRQRQIKRRETDAQLEQDRLKVAIASRTKTQDEAERQSAQIEARSTQARLTDLEELYKRSGSRDVDLARDISKQRLEIERLTADGIEKERQRLIRNRDGELEVEKAQLGARIANRRVTQEEAEKQSTQIEKEAAQNRIKDLEELYKRSGSRDVGLGQDLAKARAEAERLSGEATEKERQRQISRRNAGFEIEEAQVRLSLSNRLVSQRDAERQSDEIQLSSAEARLADMEELYKRSGSRDIDLANDISKARIEIEQKTAEAINKEREFQFSQNQQRIKNEVQAETLARQQTLNQGQIQQKDLELRNRYFDDAKNLLNAQNQAVESQLQNVAKLTSDSVARAGIERQIAENRLVTLGQQQQFERQSIENQRTIVQITSDREVAQARLQQLENQRDQQLTQNELAKAQRERRPEEEIRTIKLQLQGLEQQNSLIDQQVDQAERSRDQQLSSLDNQRKQLDLTQANARENAQIEAAQARINQYQATLAQAVERVSLAEQARQQGLQQSQKFNEAIGKGLEQQLGYLEAQAKAVNARNEFATGELSLAAELAQNDNERRSIAKSIADIKLNSTQQQIQYEKVVLELNQQQKQLQIESEKISNRSSQSQNLAEIAKARAELAKLMASPTASREEIYAAQLQLQARQQEGAGLKFQEMMLGRQQRLNTYAQQQERVALDNQSRLRVDQARVEQAKALPESQQAGVLSALKNEFLARGRATGMGTYVLPDINAARRNMEALVQEFQVPSLEVPVELQPKRSRNYIDEQTRQLEPVRSQFEEMKRSFSPTNAAEALSRRVGQLQESYTQQQAPQATVRLEGRPIIEKVVIENVSTNIENSQQSPGQDIEGVVFRTISNLTDRLQREFG